MKPRAAKSAVARRRPSSSSTSSAGSHGAAKRMANTADVAVHSSGGVQAVPGTWSVAMVPSSMSLKRCRLSASPATGLVGMQENVFLGDFFGCLGVLPLANESIVRNAMVEIMMRAVAPQQEYGPDRVHLRTGVSAMRGEECSEGGAGTHSAQGEEESWRRDLTCRDVSGNPAKCIMWCAVALGALMRGSPVEFVSGYIRLARESLAECFDGNSIENARAYLIMSFLHGIIRDQEKSEKYLSFAMNIVSKLGPGEVSEELEIMLLAAEEMTIFETHEGDLTAYTYKAVNLPAVGDVMQQKDACNIFLVADRKLNQAFMEDLFAHGAFAPAKEELEQEGSGDPVVGGFVKQPGGGGTVESQDEQAWGEGANLLTWGDPRLCNRRQEPPPAGTATKEFIRKTLPELLRLSKTLEKSDACSGAGGLVYHGSVAYMKAVEGDLGDSFKSLEACADIVKRYPGSVRFRTHLVHCILCGSHSCGRQDLYEAVREIYNSIQPLGCTLVPPFEEWVDLGQICDHVLCRSVQVDVNEHIKAKQQLDSVSVVSADGAQAAGFASPVASPSRGCDCSETERGSYSCDSSLAGSARGSEFSSATVAATEADASGASPLSEVPPEAPYVSQVLHENSVTMCRAGGPEKVFHHLPHYMATALMPEPVTPQAAAIDVTADVGWHGVTGGQQPSARGIAVPADHPVPELELFGGEPGSEKGDMYLTDDDLLDVAAVFMGEGGFDEALL